MGAYTPVLTISFDPRTPGRMLAGTFAAPVLYESTDGGVSWRPVVSAKTGPEPWPPPTHALLFGRVAGKVFAGTSDGLYTSDDGGRNWQRAHGVPQVSVYALAEDEQGTLFAAGDDPRPYVSHDGGRTWEALTTLPVGTAALSVAVSADGGWLVVGTDGGGLFQSYDDGRSWQDTGVGATYVAGVFIMGDAASGGEIGLARGRGISARSDDRGRTWRRMPEDWEGRFDAAAPLSGERGVLIATNQGILYRNDGSGAWVPWGEGIGRRGAVYALARDPMVSDRMFAAAETGLYRSDDSGLRWEKVIQGPGAPSAIALLVEQDGQLLSGGVGGVHASSDLGVTWLPGVVGLPPATVLALGQAPTLPSRLYAGLDGEGVYRSNDHGRTWEPTAWVSRSVPVVLTHPDDPDWVLVRVAFERAYLSRDGGMSFAPRWDGMTLQTEVISLALDPGNPDLVFAGATDGLYRSTDGATSWTRTPGALDGQTVYAIAKSDTGRSIWLAGATNGVYRSTDAGLSWKRAGLSEQDVTVMALTVDPIDPDIAYAGTTTDGVWKSTDAGRSWAAIGSGRAAASITALQLSTDGRWLLAATSDGLQRARVR